MNESTIETRNFVKYSDMGVLDKDVIITAGGTREQIDDVRYVGNFSSGRYGHFLANSFLKEGRRVTFIAPNFTIQRYGEIEGVEHIPFKSAEDLRQELFGIRSARIILNAAAIADYSPIKTQGKIPSDAEELTITMRRTPKILLELRKHFGPVAYIVGFKLLSNVSDDELLVAAKKQIVDNETDAVIANDLRDVAESHRRQFFIQPDQEPLVYSSKIEKIASIMAGICLEKAGDKVKQWKIRNK